MQDIHDPYGSKSEDAMTDPTTEPVRVDGPLDAVLNVLIVAALISLAVFTVIAWMRMT